MQVIQLTDSKVAGIWDTCDYSFPPSQKEPLLYELLTQDQRHNVNMGQEISALARATVGKTRNVH